jgi:polyhydroxyalkanoate synthase
MDQAQSTHQAAPPFLSGAQNSPMAEMSRAWSSMLRGVNGSAAPGIQVDPVRLQQLQQRYLDEFRQLWSTFLSPQASNPATLAADDRRFSSGVWSENRISSYTAALYLLGARALFDLADSVQADEPTRQKLRFAVQQWMLQRRPIFCRSTPRP